jgi:hypothetical protein
MARIVLRPLASPLPLAFFALVPAVFVFPPTVISSVLAFLSRETLGATIHHGPSEAVVRKQL